MAWSRVQVRTTALAQEKDLQAAHHDAVLFIYDRKCLEARCSAGLDQWGSADLYQLESWPLCPSGKGMGERERGCFW